MTDTEKRFAFIRALTQEFILTQERIDPQDVVGLRYLTSLEKAITMSANTEVPFSDVIPQVKKFILDRKDEFRRVVSYHGTA